MNILPTTIALLTILSTGIVEAGENDCNAYSNVQDMTTQQALSYIAGLGPKTINRAARYENLTECFGSYKEYQSAMDAIKAKHGTSVGGLVGRVSKFEKSFQQEVSKTAIPTEAQRALEVTERNLLSARNELTTFVTDNDPTTAWAIVTKQEEDEKFTNRMRHWTSELESLAITLEDLEFVANDWEYNIENCDYHATIAAYEWNLAGVRETATSIADMACNTYNTHIITASLWGGFELEMLKVENTISVLTTFTIKEEDGAYDVVDWSGAAYDKLNDDEGSVLATFSLADWYAQLQRHPGKKMAKVQAMYDGLYSRKPIPAASSIMSIEDYIAGISNLEANISKLESDLRIQNDSMVTAKPDYATAFNEWLVAQ